MPDSSPHPTAVVVTVPATTANLGPGFDCLGAALSRYNRFHFRLSDHPTEPLQIQASGLGSAQVSLSADNLLYQAFLHTYRHLGETPPAVAVDIEMDVPLARGLGSSATAIVGGIVAANALAGSPLSEQGVLHLAIDMEGHPDNVVPAFLGGCQLTIAQEIAQDSAENDPAAFPWTICEIPWSEQLCPIVAIPDFELSTTVSRQVLPSQYDRSDAIFNTAHLGLLLRALETGREDWLRSALYDRIHQPYRKVLIPGFEAMAAAALEAGAYGLVISGAGPTLLTLAPRNYQESITIALQHTWESLGIQCVVQSLELERSGVQVSCS